MIEPTSRSVLDIPRSRGMTVVGRFDISSSLRAKRSNPLSPSTRSDGLLRSARNDGNKTGYKPSSRGGRNAPRESEAISTVIARSEATKQSTSPQS